MKRGRRPLPPPWRRPSRILWFVLAVIGACWLTLHMPESHVMRPKPEQNGTSAPTSRMHRPAPVSESMDADVGEDAVTSSGPTKMDTAAPRMKRHAPAHPGGKNLRQDENLRTPVRHRGHRCLPRRADGGAALAHGAGAGHGQAGPGWPGSPRSWALRCRPRSVPMRRPTAYWSAAMPTAYPHLRAHCGRHGEQLSGLRLALHPGHVSGCSEPSGFRGRSTSRRSSRAGSWSSSASCSGTAGMSPGTGIPPFPAFPR